MEVGFWPGPVEPNAFLKRSLVRSGVAPNGFSRALGRSARCGHKPTVANDRFAAVQLARLPSESIGRRTPPPPTIDSGRAVAYRT